MNLVNILIMIIKLVQKYATFETEVFEYFEIDEQPNFFLGVFTIRQKED